MPLNLGQPMARVMGGGVGRNIARMAAACLDPSTDTGYREYVNARRRCLPVATNLVVNPVFGVNVTDGWAAAPAGSTAARVTSLPSVDMAQAGTLIEDFESNADWTPTNCTVADNTTAGQFKTGTMSQKVTTSSGADAHIVKTVNYDFREAGRTFRLWVYIHDITTIDHVYWYFAADAGCTDNSGEGWSATILQNGWNLLQMNGTYLRRTTTNLDSRTIRLWLRVVAATSKVATVSFDSLFIDQGGTGFGPCVMFDFDDQSAGAYTTAFPILQAAGMKANVMVIPETVGLSGSCTEAQLIEMNAAGWDLAVHGLSGVGYSWDENLTQAQIEAKVQATQDYLTGIGATRAIYHAAYPGGVSGGDSDAALTARGILTCRNVRQRPQAMPIDQPYQMTVTASLNSTTVWATLKSAIDDALLGGCLCRIVCHQINQGVEGETTIELFQQLVDYVKGLGVPVKTISDWYVNPPAKAPTTPTISDAPAAAKLVYDASTTTAWESAVMAVTASKSYTCQLEALVEQIAGKAASLTAYAVVMNGAAEVRTVTLGGVLYPFTGLLRRYGTVTIAASNETHIKLRLTPAVVSTTFYVTKAMVDQHITVMDFFCGLTHECSWTGTAHNSSSTRPTHNLRYPTTVGGVTYATSTGYLVIRNRQHYSYADGLNHFMFYIRNAANNDYAVRFAKVGGYQYAYVQNGASTTIRDSGPNNLAESSHVYIFRWTQGGAGTLDLNYDGTDQTQVAQTQTLTPGTSLSIGCDFTPAGADNDIGPVIVGAVRPANAFVTTLAANAWLLDDMPALVDFLRAQHGAGNTCLPAVIFPLQFESTGYLVQP